jgi:hypothetical protein
VRVPECLLMLRLHVAAVAAQHTDTEPQAHQPSTF